MKKLRPGNSLAVQWMGLSALTVENLGSIPGQRTKIPLSGSKKRRETEASGVTCLLPQVTRWREAEWDLSSGDPHPNSPSTSAKTYASVFT